MGTQLRPKKRIKAAPRGFVCAKPRVPSSSRREARSNDPQFTGSVTKKNCRKDDLTQNGDLTSKNGDLTSKNGDLTSKNGDLTLGKMGLIKAKWEMCPGQI